MSGVCSKCRNSLALDTHCKINGEDVCNSCKNNMQCAHCNGFLSSLFVNANNKVFHEECFRCDQCRNVLGNRYLIDGNRVSCVYFISIPLFIYLFLILDIMSFLF